MARAPPTITSGASASPATFQQAAPVATQGRFTPHAATPHNHSHPAQPAFRPQFQAPPQNFFAPPPINPHPPFSFPNMFNSLPSSSTPTIGKSFPGTSTTSTSPSVACSHTAIGSPSKTTAGAAVPSTLDIVGTGTAALPIVEGKSKKYLILIIS